VSVLDPSRIVGEQVTLESTVLLVDCVVHIGLCLAVATARFAQFLSVVSVAVKATNQAVARIPCQARVVTIPVTGIVVVRAAV
jgi:hypothetical protein